MAPIPRSYSPSARRRSFRKQWWRRKLRYFYLRFIRLRGTPNQIASGFAIGVFWGMFPLPGIQMLTAIVTAALFQVSKVAAAAGTWLTNPITTLPFTALNLQVGQTLLGREWADIPANALQSVDGFLALGGDLILAYLLGCLVTGAIGGMISYSIGLPLVSMVRQRTARQRRERHYYNHFE